MTRMTGTRRIVISAVVLAVAGVLAVMMLASRSTPSAMSGMDHGSGDSHVSSPAPSSPAPTSDDMPGMDMSGMDHGSGDGTESPAPPTTSGAMPGMDHGSDEMPGSTPSPTMSGDMPGMDHGSGGSTGKSHDEAAESAQARPLGPVLATFGGGTSAVLLTAGFLRRKDRLRNQAKAAARAARRSAK